MRNFILVALVASLSISLNSCKKCNDSVKHCQICSSASLAQATPCRTDFNSDAEYLAAIQNLESPLGGNYTCVAADEEDQVCTSGLFFKLRHKEAIDSKEAEGFDCN